MTDLRFDTLDADGALGGALEEAHGVSRAGVLRGALVGSAGLLALFGATDTAFAARATRRDVGILNYALLLEELQSAFYSEVERNKVLKGGLRRQSEIVGAHERAHVKALRKALGRRANKRPSFNFGEATESPKAFQQTAVAFEDLAVAAYKGQAHHISSRAYLTSAIAIHTVEARHAAWIRRLAGKSPTSTAFDDAKTQSTVEDIVGATRFIVRTRAKGKPRFTG
jgi:Ferritin-like domain